jgi:hypothetical protein
LECYSSVINIASGDSSRVMCHSKHLLVVAEALPRQPES